MKKILLTVVAAAAMSLTAFGQGTVSLDNLNGNGGPTATSFGLIYINTGSGAVPLTQDVNAELLGSTAANGTFTSLAVFNPASYTLTPGQIYGDVVGVGADTWFQVRAWTGTFSTYALATAAAAGQSYYGTSGIFQNAVALPPNTSPSLDSMPSFTLKAVPEPSTIALGVMGLSVLLFRRRK